MSTEPGGHSPKPLMNPYLAGFGLGLVLLAAFYTMGRGLGASGAFNSVASNLVAVVAPEHAAQNEFFSDYLGYGGPFTEWLVFVVAGAFMGGLVSGLLANRARTVIERGPRISARARLALALVGGMFMGVGAKIAGGCTSGQALSGGSLLNVGSWAAMLSIFAGAYALAAIMRRQWL